MKAANLYMLTRNRDKDFYTQYENVLSGRREPLKVKEHEFENLIHLVERLCALGVTIESLEGFYYSYTIRQIGKEFDLLKIYANDAVLNIELKSQPVSEEKIEKQLLKNQYYLSCIAPELYLFTYVDETGSLYRLEGDALRICEWKELVQVMQQFQIFETGDIDALFYAKDYLISPLNMPEKFMENRYFLTQQQETIKNEIMAAMRDFNVRDNDEWGGLQKSGGICSGEKNTVKTGNTCYWGITGMAGTGKTLLLYDLAKACAAYGRCCIVHGGTLSEGHLTLNRMLDHIDMIDDRSVSVRDLSRYRFLFVDEAQRMMSEQISQIVEVAKKHHIPCIFSYDYFLTLSKTEQRRNIPGKLKLLKGFQEGYGVTRR